MSEIKVNYDRLILARMGEIALKGLNRSKFVNKVVSNLAWRVKKIANFHVYAQDSRLWIDPKDEEAANESNMQAALDVACRVFGIVSASIVLKFDGGIDEIKALSDQLVAYELAKTPQPKTFKAEVRRTDKNFPMTSPEIASDLGGYVLRNNPELSVDVHQPDFTLYLEVRDENYLYTEKHPGLKGLPVGTSGKGMLLLSGGIDSPVAGFQMASRGMEIEAIYFHTFPFTSDEAKEKVITLARILSEYTGRIKLHIVDFTDIQIVLKKNVPMDMMTIVMRRMMMRIAEQVANQSKAQALITGESLGQVASQTAEALNCTNHVVEMPVYRPLIGIDKDEAVDISRFIGTYETSILPYEDCCTVFVARHPKTRPSLADAVFAEKKLDVEALVEEGVNKIETLIVSQKDELENIKVVDDKVVISA